jgi:putative ABC transport system permease protein
MPFGSITFVVRSAGDASGLMEPARAAIWSVDPGQTIYRQATLDELVTRTVTSRRFALAVILAFAALSLFLAIAGVYGVLSAIMTTRLREVGLRVALGASRWDILRLVFGRGLGMAGVGLIVGMAASIACYLPARRAAAADPIVVLRTE